MQTMLEKECDDINTLPISNFDIFMETVVGTCGKVLLTCVCVCLQRSRFVCGSAVAVWRSSPVAELATSSESNIHTPSLGAAGLCLQGNTYK